MPDSKHDPRMVDAHRHGPVDRLRVLALRCVTFAEIDDGRFDDPGPLSIGLHPWDVRPSAWESELRRIESRANSDSRVVAIGEAGLDRSRGPDTSLQKEAFVAQAELATRLGLPLVIHCVRSGSDLLEIHRRLRTPSPWILHGWSGAPEQTRTFVESTDAVFSFGPAILRPEAKARESARRVPDGRILVETDISGLDPELLEQEVAMLRNSPPSSLRELLHSTWRRLFPPRT